VRTAGEFVENEPGDAAAKAAAALQSASRVAVIASAASSIEEAWLARRIAQQVGAGPCIVPSPAVSEIPDDGKLISTDRYPNRAGLVALGYEERATPPSGVDAAIVLRADVVAQDEALWGEFLESLTETVFAGDEIGKSMAYADHVLAIASHFESAGAFVNRRGRLQLTSAPIAPPGRAVPGWQVLANLLSALGGPHFDSIDDVFAAACVDLGLGAGRTHADVGPYGTPLASWNSGSAASTTIVGGAGAAPAI
jgi:NADH dehydrogenase/NADH:ubiquinone oxidoreductase subunit G